MRFDRRRWRRSWARAGLVGVALGLAGVALSWVSLPWSMLSLAGFTWAVKCLLMIELVPRLFPSDFYDAR